jgi:hypothetical protein
MRRPLAKLRQAIGAQTRTIGALPQINVAIGADVRKDDVTEACREVA